MTQKSGRFLCDSLNSYAGVRKALPRQRARFLRTARATRTMPADSSGEAALEQGPRLRSNRRFYYKT